jgi:4-hydroxybenzoate polyprenyltransferase
MGGHVRAGVGLCYGLALLLWGAAFWMTARISLALVALLPLAVHFFWQIAWLKQDGADPLAKFRSNRFAGLLMFLACVAVGSA